MSMRRIQDLQRAAWRPDQPGDGEFRIAQRANGRRAHAEALARFGPVTVENAGEFVRWQQARMTQLDREAWERIYRRRWPGEQAGGK